MNAPLSTTFKYTLNKCISNTFAPLFCHFRFDFHFPYLVQDSICEFGSSLRVSLHSNRQEVKCPYCNHNSHHLHSHYIRHIQDIEVYDHSLELLIKVGKYYCHNPACSHKIFCEPLPLLARRYGRRSNRVEERIKAFSLDLPSRKSSILLGIQHITVSSSSCLRILQRYGKNNPPCPKSIYVGIDDLAYKKGHDYMSIVVDQMTHTPIALLEDRNGEALDYWLSQNPQIQYISRDRGRCFTEAITRILPGATQICDRFHLVKNMTDTMVPEIEKIIRQTKRKIAYEYPTGETAYTLILEDIFNMGIARHKEKLQMYRESLQLRARGLTIEQIAKHFGKKSQYIHLLIHNKRMASYMNEEQKIAFKYARELADLIAAGCMTVKILAQKMGTKITSKLIARITESLRKLYKQKRKEVQEHNEKIKNGLKGQRISQNQIRKYIMTGKSENTRLTHLHNSSPQIRDIIGLCREFRNMINGKEEGYKDIRKWIKRAKNNHNRALANFAYGIEKEAEAVQAAIDIPFSNGVLEGTVNKAKAIKRQMFNKAGIQLLRAKILYST